MIYFDNAATAKPCKEAIDAFVRTAERNFGNPSSLHVLGIEAEKTVTAAKKTILGYFPEKDAELIFTSGATESNNLAVFGLFGAYGRKNNKIITTAAEHKSVSSVISALESAEVIRLSPKDFKGSDEFVEGIATAVDDNTVLVSVTAVNSENGYITDTKKVYNTVKRKNPRCLIHTDGVQGFLKMPLYGDTISVSAHKIHGIKGIGGLYMKKGIRLKPLQLGGGQQRGLRAGTEAVELIAAFEVAVKAYKYSPEYFRKLTERLLQLLNEKIGVNNIGINSFNNVENIINFSVKGIKSEILTHFLAENEIYVSSGSACAKGKKSEILPHFGISPVDIDSALRLSFSAENTERELEVFTDVLKKATDRFLK